ncbi:farnesyl-diphosphate farnesyltransferase [Cupriavidus sp. OV038]|uniref:presqualene diphosphate synthase HpnD n=1 Tax=unclassified Cupriavidus TaxID=2640874 RepID=UPI0008F0D839|nr:MULTISPECIES: presqualene diphosphate synthase HpnD [unclassified Cupriavidus]SFB92006.1 farnesyl-diphosphate farnesyltransferase [Cupriavidus sp. OV038]SFO98335.1 farnesyl-diphosphate farnesyltransferase [Cupriavidus sp. OV096]
MTPDQYCQDKAAPGGSLPYYSFLFLPTERRRAITALYAFRRELEAIIDESHDAGVAHQRLDWWRGELRRLYDGQPSHPVTQALQPHIAPCGLPQSEFSEMLDGMEMDLTQTRYLDEAGLKRYCQCAGGAMGVLSARVLGFSDPRTLDFARQLGLSMQRATIVRDVGEDARQGRIYLPVDTLQRHEVPAADILQSRYSERFVALMREQAEVARTLYREALALLPRQDRRAQRAALVMAALSHAQLDEIEADQFQVLTQRIALTPMRMLWIAWKTWLRNR